MRWGRISLLFFVSKFFEGFYHAAWGSYYIISYSNTKFFVELSNYAKEAEFLIPVLAKGKMGVRAQTAMVIDDDIDFTVLLSHILEQRKIHVLALHTLQEADDYLTYLKPNVIFIDNSFPEGLGINFISRIKAADTEIKIIMISGDSALWIHEKAMEEGIDFFLQKPISKQVIDGVLDQLKFRKAQA